MKQIVATPDRQVQREQPVVKLLLTLENKTSRKQEKIPFHVEIRWSHGGFGGNPEAKLYKEFAWLDLPFVTKILGGERYQKTRLIAMADLNRI